VVVAAHTDKPKTVKELSGWNNFCDAFLISLHDHLFLQACTLYTVNKICAPALTPILPY